LVADRPLEPRHSDYPLSGDWHHFRDCHVLPDLVLIYAKRGDDVLVLARLGTHSDLGL
jgi:mRNA interferase YafQ